MIKYSVIVVIVFILSGCKVRNTSKQESDIQSANPSPADPFSKAYTGNERALITAPSETTPALTKKKFVSDCRYALKWSEVFCQRSLLPGLVYLGYISSDTCEDLCSDRTGFAAATCKVACQSYVEETNDGKQYSLFSSKFLNAACKQTSRPAQLMIKRYCERVIKTTDF